MANYVIPTSLIFLVYEEEFEPVGTWYMTGPNSGFEKEGGVMYPPPKKKKKKVTQALKIHSCWCPPLLKKKLKIICQLKGLASFC